MLQNSWSLKLSEVAQHITIARLPTPSFVYQGKSNQLLVYCSNETKVLPIHKEVLALNTIMNDLVLILTRYSLNCFDLLNNEEKFVLEFESAEKLFVFSTKIYVVSRASLFCYNLSGEELYVNHVSSNITALHSITDKIQSDQVIICTDEMTMLRYNKLNIVFDYGKVIGNVTSLCWIGKGVMVGTEEGPVAYYESKKYKWRAKSVHSVQSIVKFQEHSSDTQNRQFKTKKPDRIIVIRKDGNLEIRDWENGSTLSKLKIGQNVSHSFVDDFRGEGISQIICCLESGTISAFNIKDEAENAKVSKNQTLLQQRMVEEQLEALNKAKQELLFNIAELKNQLEKGGEEEILGGEDVNILSQNFKMSSRLEYRDGLILRIVCQNGFMSGLTFEQPILPMETERTSCLEYKFSGANKNFGDISCEVQAHSTPSNFKFEVRRLVVTLPKFWKWGYQTSTRGTIAGRLRFKLIERNARFIMWIKQCFNVTISKQEEEKMDGREEIKFRFYNWYDKKCLQLNFIKREDTVEINCDCLKTMGEIFQDLINFIGLKHVNSELLFPAQKQKVKEVIEVVERLMQTKVQLTNDLADFINTIKFLLVKGESARLVGSMSSFRRAYGEIVEHNNNLITETEKKNANSAVLTETLKTLNTFVNQIANVRYGEPKNQVISKCREAIKNKRFPDIYSLMDRGVEKE